MGGPSQPAPIIFTDAPGHPVRYRGFKNRLKIGKRQGVFHVATAQRFIIFAHLEGTVAVAGALSNIAVAIATGSAGFLVHRR